MLQNGRKHPQTGTIGAVMSFQGGCLCGAARYTINRSFLNAMHCYCGMCRKAHGTLFSTHIVVKPQQLEWHPDADSRQSFESSPRAYREFCPHCGTHLLVHGQTGDDTLAVPAGTLDEDVSLTILGHMFMRDKPACYEIRDALPQHDGWPPGFHDQTSGASSGPAI